MDITNEHRVAVADAETHAVFWYIHIEPYRRHALMLRRDGRVMLLNRYGDFNSEVSRSDWHGEHTFFTRVTEDFTQSSCTIAVLKGTFCGGFISAPTSCTRMATP